ncbi:MAG: hypothetical protein AB1610_06890 [Nitrospirota bacterium]
MEKYFFMKHLLQLISQGAFFRKVFVTALRILSVVIGFAGITGFVYNWNFIAKLPASKILGGIIFQLLFVVAIYMVIHSILIRAKEITELSESEFTAVPIMPVGLKLLGEIYCCFVIPVAIGGGIFIWFAGLSAFNVLRKVAFIVPKFTDASFTGGILYILYNLFFAFFVFVFLRFLSEMVIMITGMARDIKYINRK